MEIDEYNKKVRELSEHIAMILENEQVSVGVAALTAVIVMVIESETGDLRDKIFRRIGEHIKGCARDIANDD